MKKREIAKTIAALKRWVDARRLNRVIAKEIDLLKFHVDMRLLNVEVKLLEKKLERLARWIPVSEGLPEPFISVLVQMPGEEPCPTVREGFLTDKGVWYAAHFERQPEEVTHWTPMPEFYEGGGK